MLCSFLFLRSLRWELLLTLRSMFFYCCFVPLRVFCLLCSSFLPDAELSLYFLLVDSCIFGSCLMNFEAFEALEFYFYLILFLFQLVFAVCLLFHMNFFVFSVCSPFRFACNFSFSSDYILLHFHKWWNSMNWNFICFPHLHWIPLDNYDGFSKYCFHFANRYSQWKALYFLSDDSKPLYCCCKHFFRQFS